MSYFNDVYLLRLNRYGDTIQDRILGEMEHDFSNYLLKSPNKVDIYLNDNSYSGILQTVISKEDIQKNYLLTSRSLLINTGTILYSYNRLTGQPEYWLTVQLHNFETTGYNRYTVILLDKEIEWIGTDQIYHKQKAHISGPMDKEIITRFKIVSDVAASTPTNTRSIITTNLPSIDRETRITMGTKTWKVTSFDNDTIDNVIYITLEEAYTSEEDIPLANSEKLDNWTFSSSLGKIITLAPNTETNINFFAYYNGFLSNSSIKVTLNSELVEYSNNKFITGEETGTINFQVSLLETDTIFDTFQIIISEEEAISCGGPDIIKIGTSYEYVLSSTDSEYTFELTDCSINDATLLTLDSVSYINGEYILTVTPQNIGEVILTITDGINTSTKTIKINSFWM